MEARVTQDPHKPVPVEVIAASIKEIATAMRKLQAGPLNEHALVLLIHHSAGVPQKTVRAVMHSIASLERDYLKTPRAGA